MFRGLYNGRVREDRKVRSKEKEEERDVRNTPGQNLGTQHKCCVHIVSMGFKPLEISYVYKRGY